MFQEHADPADIISTLNNMQLAESQYLIEKIVHMAINQVRFYDFISEIYRIFSDNLLHLNKKYRM